MTASTRLEDIVRLWKYRGDVVVEVYDLPVKFTEEEREYYANWGIKRQKLLIPLFVISGIVIGITISFFVIKLVGLYHTDYWRYKSFIWSVNIWGPIAGIVITVILVCVNMLLNFGFDCIHKKPNFLKKVQILIEDNNGMSQLPSNIKMVLWKNKKQMEQQEIALDSLDTYFDVEDNCIFLNDNRYEIGANTIESIYPQEMHHKRWLEQPDCRAGAILRVERMKDILEDYKAALAVKEKEQTWLREHGLKE